MSHAHEYGNSNILTGQQTDRKKILCFEMILKKLKTACRAYEWILGKALVRYDFYREMGFQAPRQ